MHLITKSALLVTSLLSLTACSEQTVSPNALPNPASTSTIQELMLNHIDPHADGVWNAVSTTVTAAGIDEKQPRTDDEWTAVKQHATALIEAASLLADTGRPVAATGAKSENPGIEENPEEIQKLIAANPKMFTLYAQQLRVRAEEALAAIEAKNPTALVEIGGRIDETCEQCHKVFWYPNQFKSK